MNTRTLQSMSQTAEIRYTLKGQYFEEYQTFIDYYGDHNYADKFIIAADMELDTNFKSG